MEFKKGDRVSVVKLSHNDREIGIQVGDFAIITRVPGFADSDIYRVKFERFTPDKRLPNVDEAGTVAMYGRHMKLIDSAVQLEPGAIIPPPEPIEPAPHIKALADAWEHLRGDIAADEVRMPLETYRQLANAVDQVVRA